MCQKFCIEAFYLILCLSSLYDITAEDKTEKTPLRLALYYQPLPGSYDDQCVKSAQELATAYINNNSDILPQHELKFDIYHHYPSAPHQVETGSTARSWFQMLSQDFLTQGIIGPSNSEAQAGLHEMNMDHLIPMIGYSAVTQSEFPKEFDIRVNPTSLYFFRAFTAMTQEMGWKRFGVLYSHGDLGLKKTIRLRDRLVSILRKENAEKIVVEKFSETPNIPFKDQFPKFKKNDIRIIVLISDPQGIYEVFCEAFKNGMYGKEYVYIIISPLPKFHGRVRVRSEKGDCSKNEILKVADGAFSFVNKHIRNDESVRGISGKTAAQVKREIIEWKSAHSIKKSDRFCRFRIYYSAYDAVFNMALGYHSLLYKGGKKVKDYVMTSYGDKATIRAAVSSFRNVSFEGVTGHVHYDKDNERLAEITLLQVNISEQRDVRVAYHDGYKLKYGNEKLGKYGLFRDGEIPIDGFRKLYKPYTYNVVLKYFIWSLSALLILLSLVFLIINIIHRKRSLIKMSSPNINNIILVGSVMCYITIVLHGVDAQVAATEDLADYCNEEIVVFAIGFTLLFGGLFCKTWRVYRIFTAVESLRTITIKDTQLYVMVFFLTVIDGVLCAMWLIISPYELQTTELNTQLSPDNTTQIIQVFYECGSKYQTEFEVTMFIYKGLLMIFGLFLAWETRNVEIAALNDSKQIGLSIYTVVMMGTLGTICCYSLTGGSFMNARYAVLAFSIIVSTISTLMFLFLQKWILLFGNDEERLREKQEIRSRYHSDDSVHTQSSVDSRSRAVSRKDIPTEHKSLPIVYEDKTIADIPQSSQSSHGSSSEEENDSIGSNNNINSTKDNNINSEDKDTPKNGSILRRNGWITGRSKET